jgi:bacteriocin-like protein
MKELSKPELQSISGGRCGHCQIDPETGLMAQLNQK